MFSVIREGVIGRLSSGRMFQHLHQVHGVLLLQIASPEKILISAAS